MSSPSKKSLVLGSMSMLIGITSLFALMSKETAQYFNGPSVSNVTSSQAVIWLSLNVLSGITEEEKSGIYFEYGETNQVCTMVMVYPAPEGCTPKKTEIGKTQVTLSGLKPNTSYTVTYKRDNTIRCIKAPCPENGFQSLSVEFVTQASTGGGTGDVPGTDHVTRNLWYRSTGNQVIVLQNILIEKGYLKTPATGYFGSMTLKAVKDFQRANTITPTGFVGVLTRRALLAPSNIRIMNPGPVETSTNNASGEYFEGTISAFSTQCFSDGICSVTVGGKVIITTSGWNQTVVGQLRGVGSISELDKKIGSHAKVYASKTETGYTLYGNADYYVDVQ